MAMQSRIDILEENMAVLKGVIVELLEAWPGGSAALTEERLSELTHRVEKTTRHEAPLQPLDVNR